MSALEQFLTTGVFAFILTFVRMGAIVMIMPGLGDSFVPERVRLMIAVAISFAMFPLVMDYVPSPLPGTMMLFFLIVAEFIVGLFFGTIARIFMTALDTAGMAISISTGLGNAQVFNPSMATQGSLVGAFLSITGVAFLFASNLHHLLIMGIVESYELFPIGVLPDSGSMAELIARAVSSSFNIGIKLALPFLVLTLLIYVGMGVLARLMPQVQVFLVALPMQIMLGLITMLFVIAAIYMYWIREFENAMVFFLSTP